MTADAIKKSDHMILFYKESVRKVACLKIFPHDLKSEIEQPTLKQHGGSSM